MSSLRRFRDLGEPTQVRERSSVGGRMRAGVTARASVGSVAPSARRLCRAPPAAERTAAPPPGRAGMPRSASAPTTPTPLRVHVRHRDRQLLRRSSQGDLVFDLRPRPVLLPAEAGRQ